MTGRCLFCGKEHEINAKEGELTEEQADSFATDACDCEKAVKARGELRKRNEFATLVSKMFGDKYPTVAWMMIVGYGVVKDPDSDISSVSVTLDDRLTKYTVKVDRNGDGLIETSEF